MCVCACVAKIRVAFFLCGKIKGSRGGRSHSTLEPSHFTVTFTVSVQYLLHKVKAVGWNVYVIFIWRTLAVCVTF